MRDLFSFSSSTGRVKRRYENLKVVFSQRLAQLPDLQSLSKAATPLFISPREQREIGLPRGGNIAADVNFTA